MISKMLGRRSSADELVNETRQMTARHPNLAKQNSVGRSAFKRDSEYGRSCKSDRAIVSESGRVTCTAVAYTLMVRLTLVRLDRVSCGREGTLPQLRARFPEFRPRFRDDCSEAISRTRAGRCNRLQEGKRETRSGRNHRMLEPNRGCVILTARSRQIPPDLVNQIDGAEVWAICAGWQRAYPPYDHPSHGLFRSSVSVT